MNKLVFNTKVERVCYAHLDCGAASHVLFNPARTFHPNELLTFGVTDLETIITKLLCGGRMNQIIEPAPAHEFGCGMDIKDFIALLNPRVPSDSMVFIDVPLIDQSFDAPAIGGPGKRLYLPGVSIADQIRIEWRGKIKGIALIGEALCENVRNEQESR